MRRSTYIVKCFSVVSVIATVLGLCYWNWLRTFLLLGLCLIGFGISLLVKGKVCAFFNFLCFVLLAGSLFLGHLNKPSDEVIWNRRNVVVREILDGKLVADDNGVINLPDGERYRDISDSDRVVLLVDGNRRGIYFYIDQGLLESSTGYLYLTDRVSKGKCDDSYRLVNFKHLRGRWYQCATD
ncbi:hypothetical protein lbkm_0546 [Lachnospiraceae bacterium KM106-2]|nr:hypothetical protein lbkm_0546 [Lachnospiraceae bacterium KM106-2]